MIKKTQLFLKHVFKTVADARLYFLVIFLSLILTILCGSCFFDNTPDFIASSIYKTTNSQVLYSVLPTSRDVNFASRYRRQVVECKYQTDLTGSSVLYYSANYSDDFKPASIDYDNHSFYPCVIGSFDSSFNAFRNFQTIDGFNISQYENVNSDEVFVSEYLAESIIESGEYSSLENLVNTSLDIKFYYPDGAPYKMSLKIIGIIKNDSASQITQFESETFILCPFNDVIQYRLTYSALKAILKPSEKAANRFLISNFEKLIDSSSGELCSSIFEIINGVSKKGKLDNIFQKSKKIYKNNNAIVGSLITIIFLSLESMACIAFFYKAHFNLKKRTYILAMVDILLLFLLFFIFYLIPPFFIGDIPICFLTPISSIGGFSSFLLGLTVLFVIATYKKERNIENVEYTSIDI